MSTQPRSFAWKVGMVPICSVAFRWSCRALFSTTTFHAKLAAVGIEPMIKVLQKRELTRCHLLTFLNPLQLLNLN